MKNYPWYEARKTPNGAMRMHTRAQLWAIDALKRRVDENGYANFGRDEVRLQTWMNLQDAGYCRVMRQNKLTLDIVLLPEVTV